jgi:hypothetical protein
MSLWIKSHVIHLVIALFSEGQTLQEFIKYILVMAFQSLPFCFEHANVSILHTHQTIHKQDRQCKYHVFATIVAVLSITHCECVCNLGYPACNAHAPNCHLWLTWLYSSFLHYLINGMIKKKKVCLFFSTKLSETSLILRWNEWVMIKNV